MGGSKMTKERLSKIQKEILRQCKLYSEKRIKDGSNWDNEVMMGRGIAYKVARAMNKMYGGQIPEEYCFIDERFQASYSRSLRNLVKKGYIIPLRKEFREWEEWVELTPHKPIFKLSEKALSFLNVKKEPLNNKGGQ